MSYINPSPLCVNHSTNLDIVNIVEVTSVEYIRNTRCHTMCDEELRNPVKPQHSSSLRSASPLHPDAPPNAPPTATPDAPPTATPTSPLPRVRYICVKGLRTADAAIATLLTGNTTLSGYSSNLGSRWVARPSLLALLCWSAIAASSLNSH